MATVAIPVLNGGERLRACLEAVCAQRVDSDVELLICDSGSTDGSVAAARRLGARVIEIPRARFSHSRTRNLLMAQARGRHVAFLTQDAVPAHERWLAELLSGFSLADDVALTFGPYLPRSDASASVARELDGWFASLSPDGEPCVDRLGQTERAIAVRELLGRRGFFTDANGCVLRSAWAQVPFPDVRYAEDHALAHAMLRGGYAKAYVPRAAVIHSHEYSLIGWLRRSFDETRATRELYGWEEPGNPRIALRNLRGGVGADWRASRRAVSPRRAGPAPGARAAELQALARSLAHHGARAIGALLGVRADRLPPRLTEQLSLERRR